MCGDNIRRHCARMRGSFQRETRAIYRVLDIRSWMNIQGAFSTGGISFLQTKKLLPDEKVSLRGLLLYRGALFRQRPQNGEYCFTFNVDSLFYFFFPVILKDSFFHWKIAIPKCYPRFIHQMERLSRCGVNEKLPVNIFISASKNLLSKYEGTQRRVEYLFVQEIKRIFFFSREYFHTLKCSKIYVCILHQKYSSQL